jgi:transcriptional regulator
MYVPPAFAVTDRDTLHAFVEANSFGQLVSVLDGVPFVSHLPFLLDRESNTLIGHMAKANPQWRQLADRTALCVFAGPHAYVSPTWYEEENTVPTWNYVAVHVYGRVQLVEDTAGILDIVRQSVDVYERGMPQPWTLGENATFLERMALQIVGFRIAIERIEGKWKLNQNHPAERRAKVIRALGGRTDENSRAVAGMMAEL